MIEQETRQVLQKVERALQEDAFEASVFLMPSGSIVDITPMEFLSRGGGLFRECYGRIGLVYDETMVVGVGKI